MAFETQQYSFLYKHLSEDSSPILISDLAEFEKKYRQLEILETPRGIAELVSLERIFQMLQYQAYFALYTTRKSPSTEFNAIFSQKTKQLQIFQIEIRRRYRELYSVDLITKLTASLQVMQLLESARTGKWKEPEDIREDLAHIQYTTRSNGDILPDWC